MVMFNGVLLSRLCFLWLVLVLSSSFSIVLYWFILVVICMVVCFMLFMLFGDVFIVSNCWMMGSVLC